jgi:methylmalonyl-CoA/ethylmalonyl-CoA epimerase
MDARKLKVVTVAVKDLDQALKTFQASFGFPVSRRGKDARSGASSAYLKIGDAEIELVAEGAPSGPVADFVAQRGEGLFLLKLEVVDLDAAVRELESRGVAVRAETSSTGQRVAWVGPQGTNGVLLQLAAAGPSTR